VHPFVLLLCAIRIFIYEEYLQKNSHEDWKNCSTFSETRSKGKEDLLLLPYMHLFWLQLMGMGYLLLHL